MTSAEFAANRENFCYRHPDRQSFVLCQRCLRTICPECQTQAAVGVICPECMRAQHQAVPRAVRPRRAQAVAYDSRPLTTYALIAITVAVYLTQLIPGSPVERLLLFAGVYVIPTSGAPFEPWRLLTTMFLHGSILHIGLNMLALWMIGRILEPLIGRWRLLALYLISGLGGSVACALLVPTTPVIGASGAIFGLFGALLVISRHLGADITGIAVVIGVNLVIGFIPGFGIAWQAHVGGLVAGAACGLVLTRTRGVRQQRLQVVLLSAVVVVLVALLAIPAVVFR